MSGRFNFLIAAMALISGTAMAKPVARPPSAPSGPTMVLTGAAFSDNEVIPDKFTGAATSAVSPPLSWTNVPQNTQSFTIVFHDIESALNHTTNDVSHWLIFNIPGIATGLPEARPLMATLPDGSIQPKNLRGTFGFMGPGAPPGNYHHYLFELYALDAKLPLSSSATRDDVLAAMNGHIIGKAALIGRFHH